MTLIFITIIALSSILFLSCRGKEVGEKPVIRRKYSNVETVNIADDLYGINFNEDMCKKRTLEYMRKTQEELFDVYSEPKNNTSSKEKSSMSVNNNKPKEHIKITNENWNSVFSKCAAIIEACPLKTKVNVKWGIHAVSKIFPPEMYTIDITLTKKLRVDRETKQIFMQKFNRSGILYQEADITEHIMSLWINKKFSTKGGEIYTILSDDDNWNVTRYIANKLLAKEYEDMPQIFVDMFYYADTDYMCQFLEDRGQLRGPLNAHEDVIRNPWKSDCIPQILKKEKIVNS